MPKKSGFEFEKGLNALEKIVEKLEQGNTTLEDSLEQFSRAINLLKDCQLTLQQAEQRVQILISSDTVHKHKLQAFTVNEELV